jgi:Fe-Mn family superoxide dismutase
MIFEIPKLPYGFNELEPHYDSATVEIHYSKHHAAYAANLNKAVEMAGWQGKSITEILTSLEAAPEQHIAALRNHGGGYHNHCLFWESLSPKSTGKAFGKLAEAINAKWGSFEAFAQSFAAKALGHFGSGWAWLVKNKAGELEIIDTHDQISPVSLGFEPIIVIDVWEHAYYLKYKNVRADWLKAWWNIANWEKAEERYID